MEPAYSDEDSGDLTSSIPANLSGEVYLGPAHEVQLNKLKDLQCIFNDKLKEIEVKST